MGLMNICPNCGSDWCSGDCITISPDNLRKFSECIPDRKRAIDLESIADYLKRNPEILKEGLTRLRGRPE